MVTNAARVRAPTLLPSLPQSGAGVGVPAPFRLGQPSPTPNKGIPLARGGIP